MVFQGLFGLHKNSCVYGFPSISRKDLLAENFYRHPKLKIVPSVFSIENSVQKEIINSIKMNSLKKIKSPCLFYFATETVNTSVFMPYADRLNAFLNA
jgi:hypothetical protein